MLVERKDKVGESNGCCWQIERVHVWWWCDRKVICTSKTRILWCAAPCKEATYPPLFPGVLHTLSSLIGSSPSPWDQSQRPHLRLPDTPLFPPQTFSYFTIQHFKLNLFLLFLTQTFTIHIITFSFQLITFFIF